MPPQKGAITKWNIEDDVLGSCPLVVLCRLEQSGGAHCMIF
jgi:hypothetical protein